MYPVRMTSALAIVAGCCFLVACGGDDDSDSDASTPEAQFMFVHHGDAGTIDQSKGTLVLSDPAPVVTYFSDRPERVAGHLSFEEFKREWGRLFGADPPNAAVDVVPSSGKDEIAGTTVTIVGPPAGDARRVTYPIAMLDGEPLKRLAGGPTSVFIDGASQPGSHPAVGAGAVICGALQSGDSISDLVDDCDIDSN